MAVLKAVRGIVPLKSTPLYWPTWVMVPQRLLVSPVMEYVPDAYAFQTLLPVPRLYACVTRVDAGAAIYTLDVP